MAKTPTPQDDKARAARKVREGIVASTEMDKTAVVVVTTRKPHPADSMTMVRSSRLNAHARRTNSASADRVRIHRVRRPPVRRPSAWRLVEVLERRM
jgi:small subunit ribosomal protein S17